MFSYCYNMYIVEFGVYFQIPGLRDKRDKKLLRWFQRDFDSLDIALAFAHECSVYWIWNKSNVIARSSYEV